MFKYFVLTTIAFSCLKLGFCQDLGNHEWKYRLVLLLTDDLKNDHVKTQLTELRSDEKGLSERKIKVYLITPNVYKIDEEHSGWKPSSELYKKYKRTNNQTEIILVGLDGFIKLQQNTFF